MNETTNVRAFKIKLRNLRIYDVQNCSLLNIKLQTLTYILWQLTCVYCKRCPC